MTEMQPSSANKDLLKLLAIISALVVVLFLAGRSFYAEYLVEKNEQTAERVDVAEFLAAEKSLFGQHLAYKDTQPERLDDLTDQMETLISKNIRKLGANHPLVGDAYFHLGYMYHENDKHALGEKRLLTALDIYRNSIGENHEYVGMTYSNLGHTQWSQSRFPEALNYYKKARQNLIRHYATDHYNITFMDKMISKTENKLEEKTSYEQ